MRQGNRKRAMDVVASSVGLLLASPFLIIACVLVWLEDRRNPFYVASRVGRAGRPFHMVKLRTMVVRADRTGVDSTAQDDPRITNVGRMLRRVKLDECSQLLNVLRGDMSLVGPRPDLPEIWAAAGERERQVLSLRPGLTGAASLAFRNEEDLLAQSSPERLTHFYLATLLPTKTALDLDYAAKASFWSDCRILLRTLLRQSSGRVPQSIVIHEPLSR